MFQFVIGTGPIYNNGIWHDTHTLQFAVIVEKVADY